MILLNFFLIQGITSTPSKGEFYCLVQFAPYITSTPSKGGKEVELELTEIFVLWGIDCC